MGTIGLNDEWVLGLFVLPEYAGRGIGSRLLGTAEHAVKTKGIDRARVHVALNAAGFYKKHGYKMVKPVFFEKYGKTYMMTKKLGAIPEAKD